MEIYLVRHGQTDANYEEIMQGRKNNLLNESGRQEALMLRKKIKDIPFTICYSSPLIRAMETAMLLVGDQVEIIRDERLIERDLGRLEGKKRGKYDQGKYWDYFLNSDDDGVEKVQDIFKRCTNFLDELSHKYQNDEKILIVTHAAIIRTFYHLILRTPKDKIHPIEIQNCCLLKYTY